MKLYYRAVTQDSKTIRGLIEAKDIQDAAHYLKKHNLIPITILPESKIGLTRVTSFFKRASQTDLIFFTRQLASTLTSGLTLMQSLGIIKNQMQSPAMGDVVQNIITDVQDGKTFSQAIEKYPTVFEPIYIALIRTAETSGLMDKVLVRLANNLEKKQRLQAKIKGAMMYPSIIIVMMILVITVIMIVVVPQLTQLYSNTTMALPLSTQILIGLSKFTINFWYIVLGGTFMGIYFFRKWHKKESGKRIVDKYILEIPVYGKLIQETMMAEFTQTLGLLVSSGSLVVDSLLKSSNVVDNVLYKDGIALVAKRVEKGITMGDAMEASPLFPPMVVEMVKIGEQTGKLDESLIRASEYYEREIEQTVKILTTLMEPIIMIILAVAVGFLILAVITPIYNLMSSIQ